MRQWLPLILNRIARMDPNISTVQDIDVTKNSVYYKDDLILTLPNQNQPINNVIIDTETGWATWAFPREFIFIQTKLGPDKKTIANTIYKHELVTYTSHDSMRIHLQLVTKRQIAYDFSISQESIQTWLQFTSILYNLYKIEIHPIMCKIRKTALCGKETMLTLCVDNNGCLYLLLLYQFSEDCSYLYFSSPTYTHKFLIYNNIYTNYIVVKTLHKMHYLDKNCMIPFKHLNCNNSDAFAAIENSIFSY